MVSNQFNIFGTAPDHGTQDGPVWGEYGGIQGYMRSLETNFTRKIFDNGNYSIEAIDAPWGGNGQSTYSKRQGSDFWLMTLGPLGKVSLSDV